MDLGITRPAADVLTGALFSLTEKDGWSRPSRFTPEQLRALGSCRAWHPGLFRQMAACSAGIALEFETDATRVALEVRVDPTPAGTASVLAAVRRVGQMEPPFDGISIEVDGTRMGLVSTPGTDGLIEFSLDSATAPEPGLQRLPGMGEPHRVRVWLPCLSGCAVRSLTSDGTYLEPVPAKGELLVLGDSIAQGFVTADPALSWAARVAEARKLTLVNQGVGGQVFQPGTLVGLAEATRPEAIVVEFGENYRFEPCQAARVEHDIRTYLYELSEAFGEVSTWVITPMPYLSDIYHTHPKSCYAHVADLIATHAAAHPQMRMVDGFSLLDAERLPDLIADGSDHPNPAGQALIAERLLDAMDGHKKRRPAAESESAEPADAEKDRPSKAAPARKPAKAAAALTGAPQLRLV